LGFCNHCRDRSGKKNPFYGKLHTKETIDRLKLSCGESSKLKWENKEYRNKVIKSTSKPRNPSFGKEQSKRVTQWYKNNPEQIDLRRESMKKSWLNGKIISNGYSCNRSKIQESLLKDIEKIYGQKLPIKTLRFSDGSYLFPDIIIEDIGLIIELYGNFWHASPKRYLPDDIIYRGITAKEIWNRDNKRLEKLTLLKYQVIIIWEYEYTNNKEGILRRLNELINYESCAW
jgi:G:T-mismatch repair DNA endonuclease (very short patch repair protein)